MGVIISDRNLQAMYEGGHASPSARRLSRMWAAVFSLGLMPRRWVTLEVVGRRSGRVTRFPLGIAVHEGQRYLVPMLGEGCNWVRNVRAAGGSATLRRRGREHVRLAELPVAERAPVIKSYLEQVPGARPHIQVSPRAPVGDFAAIAPRYPVFRIQPAPSQPAPSQPAPSQPAPSQPAPSQPAPATGRSARRHHPWRWVLGGIAVLVVASVLAVGLGIGLQRSPAPLRLPSGTAVGPEGPLAGTWAVAAGSLAGLRVRETVLGFGNDTVGRTGAVTGAVVISGDTVTSATFRVGLTSMKFDGKSQPQFAKSLGTSQYPAATVTLTRPVILGAGFASGSSVTVRAAADFAMHGVTRPVTVTLSARRDGVSLQAAGSIPVTFAAWDIKGPAGYGALGSLADHGTAEFLLILHRR